MTGPRCTVFVLLLVVLFLSISPQITASETPLIRIALGDPAEAIEVVRCHFDEGRIVIRHKDKLHVLHDGDEISDLSLRVVKITPIAATLAIRQNPPAGSLRIIRISTTETGGLQLREYATDPSALKPEINSDRPEATISSTAAQQPTSSSNGT